MSQQSSNTITYPEPEPLFSQKPSLRKYIRYLSFLGPGAILASMTIGQGQLILGPQIGAWAGFSLLWIITLNIGSYLIAYVSSRFTLLSGLGIMDIFAFRTRRGWVNWLFIIIIMIFVPLFTASIITTLGQTLAWIFPVGHYLVWGIAFCLIAGIIVLIGRYRLVEYTQALFIAVLGIGAVISVFLLFPDMFEILPNFFTIGLNVPNQYPAWVDQVEGFNKTPIPLIMLGYLGTLTISLVPLVGYQGWIRVKKWGIFKNQKDPNQFSEQLFDKFRQKGKITYLPVSKTETYKSKLLLKPLLIDLSLAFVIVSVVSASYMIAGHYLLGPQPDGPPLLPSDVDLIKQQAVIFSHIAMWLQPLYQISVFFALFGTVYAGFEAVTRMLYETTKHVIPKVQSLSYKRFMFYLLLYILFTGVPLAILGTMGVSILLMLSITLLFIGVVGVILFGASTLYLSQKILPSEYRLSPLKAFIILIGIFLMMVPMFFFFL